MKLEKAIRTAIEFEIKARDIFEQSSKSINDPLGKRFFAILAEDERHHVTYLSNMLKQWLGTGKVTFEKLSSTVPAKAVIARGAREIQKNVAENSAKSSSLALLQKALKAEIDTCNFYEKLVENLEDENKALFADFLEVEQAHVDFVQTQINNLMEGGMWLDVRKFGRK